jgi:uncharacterized cupin superfamily protein
MSFEPAPASRLPGGGHRHYRVAIDEPFVINLADAPAIGAPRGATFLKLEPEGVTWPDTGVNVQVMQPGEPNGRYHSEPVQEDFLVLYGECLLLVEGQERPLKQWDFVHSPAWTEHVFVGAGDGPCAVLMVGARPKPEELLYPVADVARKHGAGVEQETRSGREAYAPFPKSTTQPYPDGFLPAFRATP